MSTTTRISCWWAGTSLPLLVWFLLLLPCDLEAQQGYTIEGNQIHITSDAHWKAWRTAIGMSYEVLETTGSLPVLIEIRDLAGRRVREVYAGEDDLGHHQHAWDGTDEVGKIVPPGVYLYRVFAHADEKKEREQVTRFGTIHVAY